MCMYVCIYREYLEIYRQIFFHQHFINGPTKEQHILFTFPVHLQEFLDKAFKMSYCFKDTFKFFLFNVYVLWHLSEENKAGELWWSNLALLDLVLTI